MQKKFLKYLVSSKKSSNFASAFGKEGPRDGLERERATVVATRTEKLETHWQR